MPDGEEPQAQTAAMEDGGADALRERGNAACGEWAAACQLYEAAAAAAPRDARAWSNLAQARLQRLPPASRNAPVPGARAMAAAAAEAAGKTADLDPGNAKHRFRLAAALRTLGDYRAAARLLEPLAAGPSAGHEVRSALAAVRELAAESEDGAFSSSKLYVAAAPQEFGEYVHPALAVTDVPGCGRGLVVGRAVAPGALLAACKPIGVARSSAGGFRIDHASGSLNDQSQADLGDLLLQRCEADPAALRRLYVLSGLPRQGDPALAKPALAAPADLRTLLEAAHSNADAEVHSPPPLDPRRVRAIVAGNAFGFDEAGPTGGGGRDPAVPAAAQQPEAMRPGVR
ncbi:hypothetical protein MNEG_3798 [Monoraphidium neglectum]|uniref:Uncharacterized protein n=1 Tax=Monoraphidium neglectum TaxID=145388 RepID=A0A0D2K0M6_9CHLO|nr:hypothetical protein MNEG_3798 [Monoraphidium neglectum]KIZ04163.1 hypothetical protein MNEG_3798 [Monoraphidium neglectum]|eukprot:XP_013903182.1 hypothetical protein MNEG_3798 [Monoraphidium neglectum]